jgi:hypothetical protein
MSLSSRRSPNLSLWLLPDPCLVTFKPSASRVWQLVDFHRPTLPVHALTRVARHRLPVIPPWLSHRLFSPFERASGDAGLLLLDSGTIVRPSRLLWCRVKRRRGCTRVRFTIQGVKNRRWGALDSHATRMDARIYPFGGLIGDLRLVPRKRRMVIEGRRPKDYTLTRYPACGVTQQDLVER